MAAAPNAGPGRAYYGIVAAMRIGEISFVTPFAMHGCLFATGGRDQHYLWDALDLPEPNVRKPWHCGLGHLIR